MNNTEWVGLAAGLLGIIAWLPQIQKVWFDKRHDGISLPTLSIILIALSLWLVYGVLIDSFAVIISNILAILFIGVVVVGVIRLRRSELSSWDTCPVGRSSEALAGGQGLIEGSKDAGRRGGPAAQRRRGPRR